MLVKLIFMINWSLTAIEKVKDEIRQFEKQFCALKDASRECLKRRVITVKRIASSLTSLPADDMDEHKQFLESHLSKIYQAPDHFELFGVLDFHWNYQNYQLLDYLIQEFDLEGIKSEMNIYKEDLRLFRKKTPLKLFCKSQKKRHIEPSQKFHQMVVKFDWPDNVTLEVVEQFRQEYASHYCLQECAMMLDVVLLGSFVVTWFIPGSIVEKLKVKVPVSILKTHSVTNLEISGELVYSKPMEKVKENMQIAGAPPEMSEIIVKIKNMITAVAQAKTALESGDVSTGHRLFGDVKRSGISIMKEVKYLLERVRIVENHYREIEQVKSREIGEQYKKETTTLSQQISQMKLKRYKIHTERGEVSDTRVHLHNMLYFWKEFYQLTEHGTDCATFLQELSRTFLQRQNEHAITATLTQQVQSCTSVWECVEKKLERQTSTYALSISLPTFAPIFPTAFHT